MDLLKTKDLEEAIEKMINATKKQQQRTIALTQLMYALRKALLIDFPSLEETDPRLSGLAPKVKIAKNISGTCLEMAALPPLPEELVIGQTALASTTPSDAPQLYYKSTILAHRKMA